MKDGAGMGDSVTSEVEYGCQKQIDAEREFWEDHDSADYIDWSKAQSVVLPKLKPSTKTISLRLTESTLDQIRLLANKRDVPYQSLIKIFCKSGSTKSCIDLEHMLGRAFSAFNGR